MSPVASLAPILRACAGPQRPFVDRTFALNWAAISRELSVDPSSTTINSFGGIAEQRRAERQASKCPAPLYTGIMTDIDGPIRVSIQCTKPPGQFWTPIVLKPYQYC